MASQAIIANQRSLGGGGSGIKINASVLSVLPSSATEGTIVVVSSTQAKQFYFGYTMPPSPVAGDVWIQTIDTTLGYPFLIGTVTLKPGATMQYTGSEWEYRNAYIGLGGKWEIFSTFSPLSALTWEQISAISKSGEDMSKFFVANEKKSILYGGESYDVQIIGTNQDELADGSGTAGLTFNLVDCLSTTYVMNTSGTNTPGWKDSNMRTVRMPALLEGIEEDVKAIIRPVIKKTSAGAKEATIEKTEDVLWIASEVEIFGDNTFSFPDEGSIYPGFQNEETRKKKRNGSATTWWTRSPVSSATGTYVNVHTDGTVERLSASTSGVGVSFCFCV